MSYIILWFKEETTLWRRSHTGLWWSTRLLRRNSISHSPPFSFDYMPLRTPLNIAFNPMFSLSFCLNLYKVMVFITQHCISLLSVFSTISQVLKSRSRLSPLCIKWNNTLQAINKWLVIEW